MFEPAGTIVIHNPVSGRPVLRHRASALARILAERGFPVERTRGPGHAEEIAATHVRDGADSVVVLGGDGTVFEAISRIPAAVALGQFPTGTVNLLARALRIPFREEAWLDLLSRRSHRQVHFARCGVRPFASVGSVGFDAEAVQRVSPFAKRWLGELAYAWAAAKVSVGYRPARLRVELDGVVADGAWLGVLVGTGPHYGGPRRIFHRADPGEPRLDVLLLSGHGRGAVARYAVGLLTGKLAAMRGVRYVQAARVAVSADAASAVELDGEAFGRTPAEFRSETQPRPVLAPTRR